MSLFVMVCAACMAGCYSMRPSQGGGQIDVAGRPQPDPSAIALPRGYRIETVATGLNMPTGLTFDGQGRICVTESGYCYGEVFENPRLIRLDGGGRTAVIATGQPEFGPWTGVTYHDGSFYIAEGGETGGGRISRINSHGRIVPLISDLPSMGDHHTNGPVIGRDGRLYFAIGSATNSGVVGADNVHFGWVKRYRRFHDIPGRDIKLAGVNYPSDNPLQTGSKISTGAFVPLGTATSPGQVIKGQVPCTGGIFRLALPDGKPELVAWGLRNPFGLAIAPDGQLWVTENQFDDRGSRPVWGTGDLLWRITPGTWYGWPDFFSGEPLDQEKRFAPGKPAPKRVLAELPNPPPVAAAKFGVHSSACGLDFSTSAAFGHAGEAFVAQFGDMSPGVGKVLGPVGFKVVRVNTANGVITDFATNTGKENAPASRLGSGGLERPIALKFSPDGEALYVLDFGVLEMKGQKAQPIRGSGILWRITREATR